MMRYSKSSLVSPVPGQGGDTDQPAEGALWTGRGRSLLPQGHLQERPLAAHGPLHGGALCSSQGQLPFNPGTMSISVGPKC